MGGVSVLVDGPLTGSVVEVVLVVVGVGVFVWGVLSGEPEPPPPPQPCKVNSAIAPSDTAGMLDALVPMRWDAHTAVGLPKEKGCSGEVFINAYAHE